MEVTCMASKGSEPGWLFGCDALCAEVSVLRCHRGCVVHGVQAFHNLLEFSHTLSV